MATKIVNKEWLAKQESKILQDQEITETLSFNPAVQALIMLLVRYGREYKVINCGAGVKTVTTLTDTCPLCKHSSKTK